MCYRITGSEDLQHSAQYTPSFGIFIQAMVERTARRGLRDSST